MLRVRAITPIDVPADELARRRRRYERLSPPGVHVTLDNIGAGVPSALEAEADIRASDDRVGRSAAGTDPSAFDVVLPDCVLDPGIDADAGVPVVGMLHLVAGHCAAFGRPFGSVTRNAAIGEELARRLERYGLDGGYVGNAVLDLDLAAIADDARWREAVTTARQRLAARGAAAVLNGCSAVELGDRVDDAAVVFDPTRLAVALLAAGAQAGFRSGGGAVRRGARSVR